MLEEDLIKHAGPLLTQLHATLSSDKAPPYVAYAASSALSTVCERLAEAPASPIGGAYSVLMPLLTQRLGPAMAAHSNKLASALLAAIGNLVTAAGAAHVTADAAGLIAGVTGLLGVKEVTEDRELMRAVHTTLGAIAGVVGAAFMPSLEPILPTLLAAAAKEVEFQLDKVEVEEPSDEDSGWEVTYLPNKGCGLIRLRVHGGHFYTGRRALLHMA